MNVTVVDAVMGSGKSQSCITYMNEHPDTRYIYITPYLPESERIKLGCPNLNFIEPSNKIPDFGFSKSGHTKYLIENGYNIASTHQMFKLYTKEMLDAVKQKKYTLIVDEEVEVLKEDEDICKRDIEWLKEKGYLAEQMDYTLKLVNDDYDGNIMKPLFDKLRRGNILELKDKRDNSSYFYWALPISLLEAFDNVIIMTYMFNKQELKYYLDIHGASYTYWGTKLCKDGLYRFDETSRVSSQHIPGLKNKIHICNKASLNAIGESRTALSGNWYNKASPKQVKRIKDNIYNYFNNFKDFKTISEDRMWGTNKKGKTKVRGKGYSTGWVVFNERATNQYKNKIILAYPFNIFAKPVKMNYFKQFGFEYNSDDYALSTFVQWIWRSAIRDGKEVWIYIPSKRMRELFANWIDFVSG